MIIREQFEAHVREQAKKEYRSIYSGHVGFPDDRYKERQAYIAARMEHEWPLVSALYAIMEAHGPGTIASEAIYEDSVTALSPYTTKPTEQR